MSLNRTLSRFFAEVRRETKRNPEFADRIDAVFRMHESRRVVSPEILAEVASVEEAADAETTDAPAAPPINPVGLFQRGGADVLRAALDDPQVDEGALRALITEHNLDPGGEAGAFGRDELVSHIVAFAQRRVERDKKLFEY